MYQYGLRREPLVGISLERFCDLDFLPHDIENLFINIHSHIKYLSKFLLDFFPLNTEISRHLE